MQAARAETFAVAGARAHDKREVTWAAGLDEAFLQCRVQRLRNAALHEARGRNDGAFVDARNRFADRDNLVLEHSSRFLASSAGPAATSPFTDCRAVFIGQAG